MHIVNTTFQILKANDDNEFLPIFTEIRRDKKVPFSLRCWFTSKVGEEIKFLMWTEGDEEAIVIGRGGIMKKGF